MNKRDEQALTRAAEIVELINSQFYEGHSDHLLCLAGDLRALAASTRTIERLARKREARQALQPPVLQPASLAGEDRANGPTELVSHRPPGGIGEPQSLGPISQPIACATLYCENLAVEGGFCADCNAGL